MFESSYDLCYAHFVANFLKQKSKGISILVDFKQQNNDYIRADVILNNDTTPSTISAVPYEGFVINIFRKDNEENAFINVFHHPSINDDKLLLCCDPFNKFNHYHTYKYVSENQFIYPHIYIGNDELLINNQHSRVYNVLISSAFFQRDTSSKKRTSIKDTSSINKVTNIRYNYKFN